MLQSSGPNQVRAPLLKSLHYRRIDGRTERMGFAGRRRLFSVNKSTRDEHQQGRGGYAGLGIKSKYRDGFQVRGRAAARHRRAFVFSIQPKTLLLIFHKPICQIMRQVNFMTHEVLTPKKVHHLSKNGATGLMSVSSSLPPLTSLTHRKVFRD
jgi:hypothetical protein